MEERACFGSWLPRSGVHNIREGKACWLITFPYRKWGGVNKWEKKAQEPTNPTPETCFLQRSSTSWRFHPHPQSATPWEPSLWEKHFSGKPSCLPVRAVRKETANSLQYLLQPITPICSRRSFLSWILCLSFFKRFSLQFRFTFEVCLMIYALSNILWVYWEIM